MDVTICSIKAEDADVQDGGLLLTDVWVRRMAAEECRGVRDD